MHNSGERGGILYLKGLSNVISTDSKEYYVRLTTEPLKPLSARKLWRNPCISILKLIFLFMIFPYKWLADLCNRDKQEIDEIYLFWSLNKLSYRCSDICLKSNAHFFG